MPSPFPGIDPFLEDPRLWRGVHHGLIWCANEQLNSKLPSGYVARIDQRVTIVPAERDYVPDIVLSRSPAPVGSMPAGSAGTATLEADPGHSIEFAPLEIHEGFIEIVRTGADERALTTIEILSFTNKRSGPDRDAYVEKQQDLLRSSVSLVEIDLLASGAYTLSPPLAYMPDSYVPGSSRAVSLHRAWRPRAFQTWPFDLRDRLPRVWAPVVEGIPEIVLDLQAVYDRMYDAAAFGRSIDYTREPWLQLTRADAEWVDELLRERGLR